MDIGGGVYRVPWGGSMDSGALASWDPTLGPQRDPTQGSQRTHIWISIYGYPYMDIHLFICIFYKKMGGGCRTLEVEFSKNQKIDSM